MHWLVQRLRLILGHAYVYEGTGLAVAVFHHIHVILTKNPQFVQRFGSRTFASDPVCHWRNLLKYILGSSPFSFSGNLVTYVLILASTNFVCYTTESPRSLALWSQGFDRIFSRTSGSQLLSATFK